MTKEMLMSNNKLLNTTYFYRYCEDFSTEVSNTFYSDNRDDFRLSRWCLKELCQLENLAITNHLHLEADPTKLVSISHTKNLAIAGICENTDATSIGIDIEWSERSLREGTRKYYVSHESELKIMNDLQIWCLKEAAFKAYSPKYSGEKTLVLTDFTVLKDKIIGPSSVELNYTLEELSIAGKNATIAICELI